MTRLSPSTLRLAAAQITSVRDPQANLNLIRAAVHRAARQGAQLVVLPEAAMAAFGSDLRAVAEPLDGRWADQVRELAAELGVLIVVGMFEPSADGRVHNTLLVTGRGVDTAYRKIHVFDAFDSRESDLVAAGDAHSTFRVGEITVGLATCYDLRFADQFTALGRAEAEVVLVAASWGDGPGKAEQWDLLTRARAADAQAWLLACDQAWTPPIGTSPLGVGRSVLVSPLGQVRAQLGPEVGTLIGEVDRQTVADIRARVPLLQTSPPNGRPSGEQADRHHNPRSTHVPRTV